MLKVFSVKPVQYVLVRTTGGLLFSTFSWCIVKESPHAYHTSLTSHTINTCSRDPSCLFTFTYRKNQKIMQFRQFQLHFVFFFSVTITFRTVSAWSSHRAIVDVPNRQSEEETTTKLSRRDLLRWGLVSPSLLMPLPSRAEESSTESEGLLSTSAVAELLQAVPTFTIVDKKGVPFMVVGEDAKVRSKCKAVQLNIHDHRVFVT